MGFLSPWFLGGLAALGLPIYIHLLRRHKTEPMKFSSLMFFEKRTQSSVKHRRLMYIALLCMRLAILLLLALAFANPFINRRASAAGEGQKLMLLAVDNSFSMRASDRLAKAKQQAIDTVSKFRPGDHAQVISFGYRVNLRTEQVDSADPLRVAIQGIEPGDERSSYAELSRTVRVMAQTSRVPVELHLFSDMQRSSMPSPFAELNQPANVKVVLHPVAPADAAEPNWFVESVSSPRSVYQAKKVRVQTTIAGVGTTDTNSNVSIAINDKVLDTKPIKIAANGRTSIEFFLSDLPYGLNRGEVRLAAQDKLVEDNKFPFAIERKEPGRVLFVYEARQPRAALYYRTGIDAATDSALAMDPVTTEQVGNVALNKYSFVVLSDVGSLPPSFEDAVKKYVNGGGSALISLGSVSAVKTRVPLTDHAITGDRYASRTGDRFQIAASVDSAHPALRRVEAFEEVKFFQTVAVNPGKDRVLAKLTDGSPLLIEKKMGEGRVLVFTSAFDNLSNDFPIHASFLPFLNETAQYLSGVDTTPANFTVGSFLELRSAKDRGTGVEVLNPDGKRALSLAEAAKAETLQLGREGFFDVRRANGHHELVAVHADRNESNLTPVPAETQELWSHLGQGAGSAAGSDAANGEKPYSLWWWFVLALLGVTFAESLFSSRYLAAEGEPGQRRQAA